MSSPYTIQQSSEMSGLSVKFIRRLKDAMPSLFASHTERGQANALLFDEEIIQVLKRIQSLKHRGRTLKQIRDEIAGYVKKKQSEESGGGEPMTISSQTSEPRDPLTGALKRENDLLRSQVSLLQELVRRAEERFDRLLPEGKISEKQSRPAFQLFLWLVEAVVVTVFASGFIFLVWFFAQKAFAL